MSHLNRKKPPLSHPVEKIDFPEFSVNKLDNGIPVCTLNAGSQDVIKIDIILDAGQWFCENPLIPVFCNRLLIEGSKKFSAVEIAEKLDYYGTFSNHECGKHYSRIQLYSLSEYFEKSVELLEDYIKHPVFPEDQLKVLVQNELQQYIVSREKTEVLASDEFLVRIFGKKHPYGRIVQKSDFDCITVDSIRQFHKTYYNSENCRIIVVGKLLENCLPILQQSFGSADWLGYPAKPSVYSFEDLKPGRYIVHKDGAAQSTIMIGKRTINKLHPDYTGLSILDTVFGGYFGSRLMTNLRERNALTYGVYSSLSSILLTGNFTISGNVSSESVDKAIHQIYKELKILQNKPVSKKELQMVKNYTAGAMLRAFDGPLPVSEIFFDMLVYGLNFDYYRNYFKQLNEISSEELVRLANEYLKPETFVEVVAGDFNKK